MPVALQIRADRSAVLLPEIQQRAAANVDSGLAPNHDRDTPVTMNNAGSIRDNERASGCVTSRYCRKA